MDELGQVVDVPGHRVAAVRRPLTVSVPAKIRRDDMPVLAESFRRPVPVPAMIPTAVEEKERRLVRITPIDVVETQPLRVVRVRGRAWHTRRQYHDLPGTGRAPLPTTAGMGTAYPPGRCGKRAVPSATTLWMRTSADASWASRSAFARTAPSRMASRKSPGASNRQA